MGKSFVYAEADDKLVTTATITEHVCPNCKEAIEDGDFVHWWGATLWHTGKCPRFEMES